MASTAPVVIRVARRVGHVTFLASARTSSTNFAGLTDTKYPSCNATAHQPDEPAGAGPKNRCGPLWPDPSGARPEGECPTGRMAGVEGLEPATSGFGDRRSSQLSYTPAKPPAKARNAWRGICRAVSGRPCEPGTGSGKKYEPSRKSRGRDHKNTSLVRLASRAPLWACATKGGNGMDGPTLWAGVA